MIRKLIILLIINYFFSCTIAELITLHNNDISLTFNSEISSLSSFIDVLSGHDFVEEEDKVVVAQVPLWVMMRI